MKQKSDKAKSNEAAGVTIQSNSWLLQQLQPEQCERARYPGTKVHQLPSAFRLDCFLYLS